MNWTGLTRTNRIDKLLYRGIVESVPYSSFFMLQEMAGLMKNKKGGTAYEMDYGFSTNEKH